MSFETCKASFGKRAKTESWACLLTLPLSPHLIYNMPDCLSLWSKNRDLLLCNCLLQSHARKAITARYKKEQLSSKTGSSAPSSQMGVCQTQPLQPISECTYTRVKALQTPCWIGLRKNTLACPAEHARVVCDPSVVLPTAHAAHAVLPVPWGLDTSRSWCQKNLCL